MITECNEQNSFTIRMDYREDSSRVSDILKQSYGIKVLRENLKAGDYIIQNAVGVERKTTLDFAQSVVDGRLFRQAAQLKKSFFHSLYIIEGDKLYQPPLDIHPNAIKGAIVSMALNWRIPILFAESTKDSALFLWLIGRQVISPYREISYRLGRRPKTQSKKQLYLLQGLPQVGSRLSMRLLDHFGCVQRVMNATEEELIQIPGIGERKAKKIRDVLTNSTQ